ncbi:putative FRIGIDA like 1 [Tripterygium wilfordii]|uniref:FRIGIDA-like protein n=1 Tax=Tripterygium wilfordii TaxID=458696 RepID=A0A7J7C2R9_TRIWF|nr:FRIGIDA-like protein 1 [Tripterygium wilfordii]KAF5728449.1 putative FRIGIDA like 1 [Tripterygium wilfordii]
MLSQRDGKNKEMTLETIEEALKLVYSKKENLKKAFDDLQSHSTLLSSSSSFSALSWSDIDAHFSSIQASLTRRFEVLQSESSTSHVDRAMAFDEPMSSPIKSIEERLEQGSNREDLTVPPGPSTSSGQPSQQRVCSAESRAELRSLCERMDGMGLRSYIHDHWNEGDVIRAEVSEAFRFSSDPGTMVLDAMEGFYLQNGHSKGDKDPKLFRVRRVCALLLEQFMGLELNFSDKLRERAKNLALEWKGKATTNGENPLEPLGFLNLVAGFGLKSMFDLNELVDYFVNVARYKQATILCRAIGFEDKVPELIQKLIDTGKELLAIKFIFDFGLTERFPPVPLLQSYLKKSKRLAKKMCKNGNSSLKLQNEATAKEVGSLKSVLKVIDDHKLEHEFPRDTLEKRIEVLKKAKAKRKLPPVAPATKPQQQVNQQSKRKLPQEKKAERKQQLAGNKRPRTAGVAGHGAMPMGIAGANSSVLTFQQSHVQPAGLLPDHPALYPSSATGPYGWGSAQATPYPSSSAGTYGYPGAPVGYHDNPNPSASYLYPPESQVPPTYYDRQTPYGGYGIPPQYHPNYYPQ